MRPDAWARAKELKRGESRGSQGINKKKISLIIDDPVEGWKYFAWINFKMLEV